MNELPTLFQSSVKERCGSDQSAPTCSLTTLPQTVLRHKGETDDLGRGIKVVVHDLLCLQSIFLSEHTSQSALL